MNVLKEMTDLFVQIHPFWIYLIVAIMLLMESSGIPVMNNTLLLFTGALASLGYLNIWILGGAAFGGSVAGACSAYIIGFYGGRKVLLRLAGLLHIDEKKIALAEGWFQRSGIWMIFLSRMTPYLRPFACFPAGITRTPFLLFLISASAGSLLWCVALLGIGWYLGNRWELAVTLMQKYTIPVVLLLLVLLVGYFVLSSLLKKRLKSRVQPEKKG
uniref:Alkaline phosphatase n=1 Tax=Thermosporothrix sp. COM3 TaxID=2490863 RepID=A0A455T1S1_9CHLR|nr:alkaline phosphatase [Thermosporothrix sp. COM3]